MKTTFIFSCSGMFRHVPACSGMFRNVPDFIDALKNKVATPCELKLPWQDIIDSFFSIDPLLQRSSASLVKTQSALRL